VAEVPPVYVEFKGDTTSLNASIGQAKKSITGFAAATEVATVKAKKLGVAQIALGGIIANVATAAAANAKTFATSFISEYQSIAGEVRSLGKVMDGTPEQLSAISFAAKRFGVDSAQLSLGIRTLSKNLVSNNEAAKSLGIQYRDANGQLLPTVDILNNLADRYKALPSKIEQNAFAMTAFGRAGKNMAPLLNLGSEGIKQLGLTAQELGMIMSGKDLEAVKAYGFAQKDLQDAIDGVKVTIGRDLLPILAASASALNETLLPALKKIVSAFTNSGFAGGVRQAQDSLQDFVLGLDGVKQAIYQVILMIASFKVAMAVFVAAPAVFGAVASAIIGVRSVMTSLYVATLLGSAGFKAFFISIKAGLISTGIGALVVAFGLLIAYIINAYTTSETFRTKVNAVFESVTKKAVIVANSILKIYNAIAKLIGLKQVDLISFGGNKAGGREDIASAYGITTSGQLTPDTFGGSGFTPGADTKGSKTPAKTALEKLQEKQQASLDKMQANLSLGLARTDDLKREKDLQIAFRDNVKKMYEAAQAAEKKARGTKNHAAAQKYLNEMTGLYAGAIESANSASQKLADSQRQAAEDAARLVEEQARAQAEAAAAARQAIQEQREAVLKDLQARLELNLAQNTDLNTQLNLLSTYRDQTKALYDQAIALEINARGTDAHAEAQNYLNQMTSTYASAIKDVNSAQENLARSQEAAAEAQKRAADETAEASKKAADNLERLNREFLRYNSFSRSSGYLAALTRTSGPTNENFSGFIEVPVVIDGQVIFRATQRYSLMNNRRNVSNGLATSGSLI
jgi:hypothetical protein